MKLPTSLTHKTEWVLVGPMGPQILPSFLSYSLLGVDGGANFILKMDAWIGDHDSLTEDPNAEHIFKFSPLKDRSDLGLALDLFTSQSPYKLHLWGFLGGRKDHELFNLGEVSAFLEKKPKSEAYFYNQKGKVTFHFLSQGEWELTHQGIFSLGALKNTSLSMKGECHYPISEETMIGPLSSFGLSNEAHGTFKIKTSGPIFLYFPESA